MKVSVVIPYFNNFIKNIPNIRSLAKINENKLLKYWEGLGYYSRVKNLKKTAQFLEKNFKGRLPNLAMYNRALSAQEVLQNFNVQKTRYGL